MSLDGGFGLYGGWAASFISGADLHFVEGGGFWFASPDVQLDVNGAWAPDVGDWFLGAGIAIRRGAR